MFGLIGPVAPELGKKWRLSLELAVAFKEDFLPYSLFTVDNRWVCLEVVHYLVYTLYSNSISNVD